MPINLANKSVDTPAYDATDYRYTVEKSEEDGVFIARVAEFPSMAADGETPDEAFKEIQKAVAEGLEYLRAYGEPIPEPFSKRQYSGTLNVRMPKHLHRQLAIEAEQEGVSLNQLINSKLAAPIE